MRKIPVAALLWTGVVLALPASATAQQASTPSDTSRGRVETAGAGNCVPKAKPADTAGSTVYTAQMNGQQLKLRMLPKPTGEASAPPAKCKESSPKESPKESSPKESSPKGSSPKESSPKGSSPKAGRNTKLTPAPK